VIYNVGRVARFHDRSSTFSDPLYVLNGINLRKVGTLCFFGGEKKKKDQQGGQNLGN
jgi:hypothetical protein